MDQKRIIDEFKELVSIEVHSRDERSIADVLKEKLTALGLTVTEDKAGEVLGGNTGNLYAQLPGSTDGEPVLFSAHMDRVGNHGHIVPLVKEEEGKIVSDGTSILAGDDIGGVTAILAMLREVKEKQIPHGPIEVAFSVCEETGVEGSRQYDFSKFRSKSAFVYDASGKAGTIVLAAPSKGRVTIRVHGVTAHAGNEPEKGLNALKVAADLIMQLPDGRLSPVSTANFSIIEAGSATNVVCDLVTITGEQRSRDAKEYQQISADIQAAADRISEKYHTKIEVELHTLYHAFKLEEAARPCVLAKEAAEAACAVPFFKEGGGGMDANHFNEHGIAAVGIGTGNFKCHTSEEYQVIDDLVKCAKQAVEIVKLAAGKN